MSAIPNIPAHAEFCVRTGLIAICDWRDYELVKTYCWLLKAGRSVKWACTYLTDETGARKRLMMHNLILPPPPGYVVDHINGNGLDNRRSNLRLATIQQNACNTPVYKCKGKTSKYKGVSYDPINKKWKAAIQVDGHYKTLSRHPTEDEAALAYNEAAKVAYGEFARLNVIEE